MKKILILDLSLHYSKHILIYLFPQSLRKSENLINKPACFLYVYIKLTIFQMMNEPNVVMKLEENICGYNTLRGFSRLNFNQGHVI